ncbi:MAG: OmpA family protein [Pseudomonadota bacterium]
MQKRNGYPFFYLATGSFTAPALLVFMLSSSSPAMAQDDDDTSELDTLVPIGDDDEGKGSDDSEGSGDLLSPGGDDDGLKSLEPLTDEGDLEDEPENKAPADKEPAIAHPTDTGFSGLVRIISGDSGEPWSWAVGIHVGFFLKDDFIYTDDTNKYVSGTASFRFTIWKFFEAAIGLKSYANYNRYSDDQFEPPLFQTLGDASLGLRFFYPVTKYLFLGLGYRAILLNKVGEVGIGTASHELFLPFTLDIQKINRKVPLRIHLFTAYYFDESANLVEDEEAARGERETLPCESDADGNYSPLACLSPVERFGLGVNRVDLMKIGLGFDFPAPYVNPFLEFNMGIPVNRQGFNCGQNLNDYTEDDYCLENKGFSSFPTNITIGMRVRGLPYGSLKGLGILVAADIGVTGMDKNNRVRELAMNPNYMIYFGISYTPVTKPKEVVKIQEVVKTEIKEPPPKPRILGKVIDTDTKSPVDGAIVTFVGRDLNALVTGADGTFVSYPFEAGEVDMSVTAEWYFDSTCAATLEETGDAEAVCEMRPMPKLATISGVALDAKDNSPLGGVSVTLKGPREKSLTTDVSGSFSLETEAGIYEVKADFEGYFSKNMKVDGPAGGSANVQLILSKKPKNALVFIKKKQIRIKKQIHFEFNSAIIKSDSFVILDSVADLMINHPELQVVEIQGHTDDKGKDDYNMQLSQDRANSVRDYLIAAGVEPDKLVAKGYGESKPIAPNVTSAGRAKNRRVEFHILSQAGEE